MVACTPPLREALNHSISSGRFIDTKIIVYSRRDSSGTVFKPKALYANSHVLKSVPYFNDLLSGAFAESEQKELSEPIDEGEQAENYGYYSDSDLEDDEDATNAERTLKKTAQQRSKAVDPLRSSTPGADQKKSAPAYGEWKEPSGKGIVVKVQDIAFVTFQAFLMYLYTGQIEFAPYGSEENRMSRSAEIVSSSDHSVPRPSPKSIYRLADKYDIPSLKRVALDSIRNGVERCDTVEQAFNKFSSSYEEVLTMHVTRLALLLSLKKGNPSYPELCEKLDEKIDRYVNRDLDHGMDAITLLWRFAKDGVSHSPPTPVVKSTASSVASRPNSPPTVPPALPSLCPAKVEVALIRSIREGILFDRKYWVRRSATGKILRPIHMSGTIVGEQLQHVNNLVKLYREDECLDLGEGFEDSDWKSEADRVDEPTPEGQVDEKVQTGREPLPLLTMGSFASWKCLFFYLCTDKIQFAPLKSQGAKVRTQYIQERSTPEDPPPCSPKTIYSLAAALEMQVLRDLAFHRMRSELSSTNIIPELFSALTSQHADIAQMQCKLLYSEFNNETTTVEGIAFIEGITGGNPIPCADALKLVLKEGLLDGIFPRCPHLDCDLHDNTTCGLLKSRVECPRGHRRRTILECAGCETSRDSPKRKSCEGCGKRFK